MTSVSTGDIQASVEHANDAILYVTFADNDLPSLVAGDYTFQATQALNVDGEKTFTQTERFRVRAPRFVLDASTIQATYPARSSRSDVRTALPHITLTRPMLPWERDISGTRKQLTASETPWIAVLLFSMGDIITDPDAVGTVTERTVFNFLRTPESGVVVPKLTIDDDTEYAGSCRTIDVSAQVMRAIAPTLDDLPLLSHTRHVRHPELRTQNGEIITEGDFAVVVASRFPRTPGPYVAHLVSFEGFLDQIINGFPGNGVIRMCTLQHWTFTCEASDVDASAILQHLVAPSINTNGNGLALRSPKVPQGSGSHVDHAKARLERGYVPVPFMTITGEETFAWYRGPFIPYTARPLPSPVNTRAHSSSDHALIFNDTHYGMFDISYACAWTLGRTMALMAPDVRQAITRARRRMRNTAAYVLTAAAESRAWSNPPFSARTTLERLGSLASEGRIRALLQPSDLSTGPQPSTAPIKRSEPISSPPNPAEILGTELANARLQSEAEPFSVEIASWLDRLAYLYGVPFNMLVPDPDALPEESLRFFLVDPGWMERFLAGVEDSGVATETDVLTQQAFTTALDATLAQKPLAGLLLRSELVSAWPDIIILATDAVGLVPEFRRALLAPNVLLVLFGRIPTNVDIVENSEGIHHGTLRNETISLRNPSTGVATGGRFPTTGTVFTRFLRPAMPGRVADVLKVGGNDGIAKALSDSTGSQGKAKDLALQLIVSALRQRITIPLAMEGKQ